MPLPLGHTAIGWAAYHTVQPCASGDAAHARSQRWAQFGFIAALANLPDLDVLLGLIAYGNGAALHRGPTHSLLFAIMAGYTASKMWRLWDRIPRFGFGLCFALVFSHVVADMLLTASPVSLWWPLELNFSPGHSGWGQVMHMVMFKSIQDAGIIVVSLIYVIALRWLRAKPFFPRFAFAKRSVKP